MKNPTIACVIDAGGRGATLIYKYAQSPLVDKLIAIPGNDWMPLLTTKPVETHQNLKTTSVKEIVSICKEKNVTLVDVAQDNAVEAGLTDALLKEGITAIGPTRAAGEIEWNKAFSRELLAHEHINQPEFYLFRSQTQAKRFLDGQKKDQKWFIKAAGLCEGKGVLPAKSNDEAKRRIAEMKRFGQSGKEFLIEKWLTSDDGSAGEEFSAFALCNGDTFSLVGFAQDHKRIYNFDEGENTGGIGASIPPLVITKEIERHVSAIFQKTLSALVSIGRPYTGVLYLGGMLVKQNERLIPYVIEYNARWGDPEAQVMVPAISSDLFTVSMELATGNMPKKIHIDKRSRVAVTGCAKGYPADYSQAKGKRIFGLEDALKIPGIVIFGSGITIQDKQSFSSNKKYLVNGGRIFHLVAGGKNILEAREKAYHAMSRISIEGNNLHYRTDIGWRDVDRIRKANSKHEARNPKPFDVSSG